jgi:hypothetical protein
MTGTGRGAWKSRRDPQHVLEQKKKRRTFRSQGIDPQWLLEPETIKS